MARSINITANNKLAGTHVLHMLVEDVVITHSINEWIELHPLQLYKCLLGRGYNAVILPQCHKYAPTLQHAEYKRLVQKVKEISPSETFSAQLRRVIKRGNNSKPVARKFKVN